uniref:Apple domain-containing protein n=1 Tax=Odontella aurita TaxID=265563 RepID=A0A7S4N8M9_9STRA|mmetsp:Transcript_52260/g.156843  ORF Transcript_52260/g.156843 Transcript_52260/m.156843 type:complete len:490 (+) Transcript_52260:85-1554(+)|eukprot:CAMPEP_0113584756 /NCGR_PEP_ID=MMETSP0015_2-20120614/33283_1 /TAXON_ID=2838 /ORGANISM="Odontella" /LENGTH=489 /DNA_ID=CAMNT_0000489847 /DNA_START=32 /DNA_END=1501 /DNA_ORIENTATION=+ /assembly_acc=CAM_ASM_000160
MMKMLKTANALVLAFVGLAAVIQPSADAKGQDLTATAGKETYLDIHRVLEGCKNDFKCPKKSARKSGRSCYDSFDDCACDPGYSKRSGGCVAEEGLCSLEYVDMVERKQQEVESWLLKAERGGNQEEQVGYIEKANEILSESWDEYNKGKASCEMFVFDEVDEGARKLRCCSFLRRAFKKAAEGFVRVVKRVVDVVVKVVKTAADFLVAIAECGADFFNKSAKCALITCAFGLIGAAADIAFTLATGGVNKATEAGCALSGEPNVDDGEEDSGLFLLNMLEGINGVVCAINRRIESPVLGEVCALSGRIGEIEAEVVRRNRVVFRFVIALQTAMCGSPGSALTELLEEVVSCTQGCAPEGNAFCNKIEAPADNGAGNEEGKDEEEVEEKNEEEEQQDDERAEPVAEQPAVEYKKRKGKACRTGGGKGGVQDKHYELVIDASKDECEKLCSEVNKCKAFEFSKNRCELWMVKPGRFDNKSGFRCYVKRGD